MNTTTNQAAQGEIPPEADAVLEMVGTAGAPASCALLTPAIRARFRELTAGQVLEVRVDDPTAREDIAAWCRLTGQELIAVLGAETPVTHYYLRKRQG